MLMSGPSVAAAAHCARRVGFLTDELYFWHNSGSEWPNPRLEPLPSLETPESKRRFLNLVRAVRLDERLEMLKPRRATRAELLRAHSETHVTRVEATSSQSAGGFVGEEAHVGGGGAAIAELAAGGALAAVEAVLEGRVSSCYALVRPPGHHAEREQALGFCLYNNVAVAVASALDSGALSRVAVVDWDVHHGNGTEAIFLDDPRVLVVSIHQDGLYPVDSGAATVVGEGAAAGTTVNIPLPPGSGIGAYHAALRELVVPKLLQHKPDLIIVSSGFDSCAMDPLGRMLLRAVDYAYITRVLLAVAARLGHDGRLVLCHEGGYSPLYVPFCGVAVLSELMGMEESAVEDAYIDSVGPGRAMRGTADQLAAIAEARAAHREFLDDGAVAEALELMERVMRPKAVAEVLEG